MGTKGRQIVGMDVDELIGLLNRALADEWLAYYQYWLGSKVVKGPMKDAVASELLLHATEELGHADLLAMRIIQLGGTPLVTPAKWFSETQCGYDAPTDTFVKEILAQNIKGERCAIGVYQKLLQITKDADPITYNTLLSILTDEVEHEEDLQSLAEDLESLLLSRK